ncbi:MAG: sigma-E factor negative regulatory protein [Pseudomonadota bacterium]|nr:sigma-E factor negative regulatory protein [Pseudomonadota bacterium]
MKLFLDLLVNRLKMPKNIMTMDAMLNNSISALVDGELDYAEGSRAVEQLLQDDHGSLQRYQLIGAAMRGEAMQINSASLFDQIHQQLEQETTIFAPAAAAALAPKTSRKKSQVVRYAMAASVAVLMVLAVVRLQAPQQQGVQLASQPLDNSRMTIHQQMVADQASAEAEIDRYLAGHQNYSSGTINPGFAATMVSY